MDALNKILAGAPIRKTLLEHKDFKLRDKLWKEICKLMSWDKYNEKFTFQFDTLMRDAQGNIFPYMEDFTAFDTLVEVEFQNIIKGNIDVPVGGWEKVRATLEGKILTVEGKLWEIYSAEGNVIEYKEIQLPNEYKDLYIPDHNKTFERQSTWIKDFCRKNGWAGVFPKGHPNGWTEGQREDVNNFLLSIGCSLETLISSKLLVVSDGKAEIKLKRKD